MWIGSTTSSKRPPTILLHENAASRITRLSGCLVSQQSANPDGMIIGEFLGKGAYSTGGLTSRKALFFSFYENGPPISLANLCGVEPDLKKKCTDECLLPCVDAFPICMAHKRERKRGES